MFHCNSNDSHTLVLSSLRCSLVPVLGENTLLANIPIRQAEAIGVSFKISDLIKHTAMVGPTSNEPTAAPLSRFGGCHHRYHRHHNILATDLTKVLTMLLLLLCCCCCCLPVNWLLLLNCCFSVVVVSNRHNYCSFYQHQNQIRQCFVSGSTCNQCFSMQTTVCMPGNWTPKTKCRYEMAASTVLPKRKTC